VLQGCNVIQMNSNFGARMRQHREQQELSLATIAARTKIKASLLEALERDDISQWPPGIYRRAYVRAYANAIGLDADTVIREFLETYPEPAEIVEPPPPPTGFRGLVGSAIGSFSRIRHTGWAPPQGASARPARPEERPGERRDESAEHAAETAPTTGRVPSVAGPAAEMNRQVELLTAAPKVPPPDKAQAEVNRPVDLLAAARLCTELGRVETADQVQPLLREAATLLDAKGLIVWVWDPLPQQLRPVLVHGYSEQVVAQLPGVGRDDDNLTAAAFRSAQTLAVSGTAQTSGALALPLMTPMSCAGVLTIELQHGSGEGGTVRAVATFFAAMLAQLVGGGTPAASEPEERPAEPRSVARS
jgi:transcriptional regulator with XRE-family HTH domain